MSTNGQIAPLDASRLTIQRAETLKPIPPPGTYGYGDIKTDHMLVMSFDPETGWSPPEIKPYGPFSIDPASNCLQYCTSTFEGLKASMNPAGKPVLFRPEANMARLSSSAARMALPPFDEAALLACIIKLVALESRWIPTDSGHSLYIRPTMIGTKPSIRVGASDHALLYVIVCPVGPYFPTPPGAILHARSVSLLAVSEHVCSWPGGTGGYKLGLNYSLGFSPQLAAVKLGYDHLLWLLPHGQNEFITEAGAMNFFAVYEKEDGALTVVTPPLDGTILPGITRLSALAEVAARTIQETLTSYPEQLTVSSECRRQLTIAELRAEHAAGTLRECFGVGTAVNVVGIDRIGFTSLNAGESSIKVVDSVKPTTGKGLGVVGRALWDKLLDVKEGRDNVEGWGVVCE
ncbi:branched-chain amino acid aminotransferase II [Roridomyces roridus]|uniref:Branched-chain-amino-acid aminotransferase n=1 Tax=Roridomyces roridus TaxID=1738132 RepID=A0AAD7FML2_9AGAR|nr:branched-chain amino acid aminotransferase II [Roridomyces roridus]